MIVKVDTTTICGTDLHILKGDVPAVTEGRILGHEAVGTVVETGAAVSGLKKGDRVLVPAITSCGRCGPCKVGMAAHCEAVGGIGWIFGHLIDGVQAEYARVPYAETSVHAVPEGVSDEQVLFLADILPTGYEIGVQNGGVQARRHDRGRRRGPGRAGGDDDRRDRRRRPDHRRRHARRRGSSTPSTSARRTPCSAARTPSRRSSRSPAARRRRGDGGGRRARRRSTSARGSCAPAAPSPTSASTARRRRCTSRSSGSRTSRSPRASSAARPIPTLLKLARDGRIEAEKLGTHRFALGEIEQAYDVFARRRRARRAEGGPHRLTSEIAAQRLLALDRLEQGLEVALAEAARAVALDDLEEQRRAVADRLGEDLQQVALVVAVDQDAEPARSSQRPPRSSPTRPGSSS